ncbi:MAG: thiamine diphosphokinase [Clostridia bacterium]|nr:thiamine diphosphokinase [Clostridia bacterium]
MNCLIVTGGDVCLDLLNEYYNDNKDLLVIAVDKGLESLYSLNIVPNHIVGDLDSVNATILKHYQNNPQITIHKYIPEKDYTDTDIALKLAIKLAASNITIIGATGTRIDHMLANIHVLTYALDSKIPCHILDSNNKIYLINDSAKLNKDEAHGKYISLIPLTTSIEGLTLKGFKYPLNNYCLTIGKSLGISNEIIQDIATIDLKSGTLIVIESKD